MFQLLFINKNVFRNIQSFVVFYYFLTIQCLNFNVIYLLVFAHPGLAPPQIGESVPAQPIAAFPVHK